MNRHKRYCNLRVYKSLQRCCVLKLHPVHTMFVSVLQLCCCHYDVEYTQGHIVTVLAPGIREIKRDHI